MAKLNIDQKTVFELFQDTKADFLIPDYQRPYAWGEKECQTLWDDIFSFAFPDNSSDKFDSNSDEYFLGPIVTFKNPNTGQKEVIDGQQRLTTLLLLLRAFYERFLHIQYEEATETKKLIAKCIWKTNEFGKPDMTSLKIDSEVASDKHKEELMSILRSGIATKEQESAYAQNYRFFQKRIDEFIYAFPAYTAYLPIRILNNCILLPIEAESQDTALRIFSTLNDRGMPLSDADIFKAQFYKHYSEKGSKDEFIKQWKSLEELCERIFHPTYGTPMDELFTRYMYYERSKLHITSSTVEALRKFYDKDGYDLLKQDETFENIKVLADFWNDINNQDNDRFSDRVLRRLFVLNYAPNGMWTYFVTVYFMQNKDADNMLDDDSFFKFLNKTIAFIWAYAVYRPGVNALRTPLFTEMANIIDGKSINFEKFKFNEQNLRNMLANYSFYNSRAITKSMLAWWAFYDDDQPLMKLETSFDTEHIYAKNRATHETMTDTKRIELLGNKALLETRINIRASDYKFEDKKKYYRGFINSRNQQKEGTQVVELLKLAETMPDFTEDDILARNNRIFNTFIDYLRGNNLLEIE